MAGDVVGEVRIPDYFATVVNAKGVARVAPQGANICHSAATIPDERMILLRVRQRRQHEAGASDDDQQHCFHSLFSFFCSREAAEFPGFFALEIDYDYETTSVKSQYKTPSVVRFNSDVTNEGNFDQHLAIDWQCAGWQPPSTIEATGKLPFKGCSDSRLRRQSSEQKSQA